MKLSLIALAAACAVAGFAFPQFDIPPVVPPHAAMLVLPSVAPAYGA
jgi:hypothetical protein